MMLEVTQNKRRQVFRNLSRAGGILAERQESDYWPTDAGQIELLGRVQDEASPPGGRGTTAQAEASQ